MKKIGITLTVFAMIMAVASIVKAEGVGKNPTNNTSEKSWLPNQYQFPQENCCGQMVLAGSCMTVCPNDDLPNILLQGKNNAMKNLTETTAKISEIDMDKDFGKAGYMLDSFYSGGKTKKSADASNDYVDLSG